MTRLCASSCFAFDNGSLYSQADKWNWGVGGNPEEQVFSAEMVFSYYSVCFATDRTILSSINLSKLFTNNQIPDATETVLPNLLPKPQITVALHQRSLVAIKPYFEWSIDNDTCQLEIDSLWSTNSSVFILGCKIDCFMHVDLEDKKKEDNQWPGFWGWHDLKKGPVGWGSFYLQRYLLWMLLSTKSNKFWKVLVDSCVIKTQFLAER